VIKVRPQGPFQGGVDLGEESADPVGCCSDLGREVVIEAAEHPEFGQRLIHPGRWSAACVACSWRLQR
jgi:hypothetical protein